MVSFGREDTKSNVTSTREESSPEDAWYPSSSSKMMVEHDPYRISRFETKGMSRRERELSLRIERAMTWAEGWTFPDESYGAERESFNTFVRLGRWTCYVEREIDI